MHWRQNAGLLKAGTRRILLGPKGIPDIIVVIPPDGKFVGLEVKSSVGRQSDNQKTFEKKIKSVGAGYYLVRSLADAKEALTKEGVLCPARSYSRVLTVPERFR